MFKKVLGFGAVLLVISMFWSGSAFAAERLYVCRPCSRDFIEVAEKVIREMNLDLEVSVKTTGCLGYCEAPAVVEFRDEVYRDMDESKLKSLLKAVFEE